MHLVVIMVQWKRKPVDVYPRTGTGCLKSYVSHTYRKVQLAHVT